MGTPQEESIRFVDTAIPLLKEFSGKLEQLRTDTRAILDDQLKSLKRKQPDSVERRCSSLRSSFEGMHPALLRFARQVSQWLEHGAIDDIARIELELRLAEFEANIKRTEQFFADCQPRE